MEWHSQDKFNSFNSWKNLLYIPWYEEIKKWKDNPQHKILTPIEASIDASPAGVCNLKCTFCNSHKFVGKTGIVSDKDLLDLHKFLLDWGVKAFCFTGDTKVKLVNGTHKTFEELTKEWDKNKQPFEVYSRDENGNIVPGVAYEPRKTREVYEIVELRLDNNKIIKCTPDHKFMLRDGTYKEAKDLTKTDSLMPLYTKIQDGYEYINDTTYRGFTHQLFGRFHYNKKIALLENIQIHHIDFNKLDNTRENLNPLTNEEHNGFPNRRKAQDLIVYNHKIVSKKLIKLNNPISVYCLTVEKYHNFALSSGVFVKNCEGGGGEPTMRKNLPEIFKLIKSYNRQSSLTTNGTNFTDELIDTLANCCRWVGISVDSSNKDTYMRIRGVDCFNKTTSNMSKLVNKVNELKTNCDVSYKFLITPDNYTEIYDACKLAKEIGVKEFHARPADMSHQGMGENKLKDYEYAVKNIEEQFEKCHQLRTENFRVFCVSHKFDSNFKPLKNFNQCYAMPILIQCCPDGNVYSCVDQRLVDDFKLGSYLPNPKQILDFWGGEKHHKLVFGDTPKKCPGRCTFTMFNETCQRIVIEEEQDYMCKWFT